MAERTTPQDDTKDGSHDACDRDYQQGQDYRDVNSNRDDVNRRPISSFRRRDVRTAVAKTRGW